MRFFLTLGFVLAHSVAVQPGMAQEKAEALRGLPPHLRGGLDIRGVKLGMMHGDLPQEFRRYVPARSNLPAQLGTVPRSLPGAAITTCDHPNPLVGPCLYIVFANSTNRVYKVALLNAKFRSVLYESIFEVLRKRYGMPVSHTRNGRVGVMSWNTGRDGTSDLSKFFFAFPRPFAEEAFLTNDGKVSRNAHRSPWFLMAFVLYDEVYLWLVDSRTASLEHQADQIRKQKEFQKRIQEEVQRTPRAPF